MVEASTQDRLFNALRACRLWHSASDEGVRRLVRRARLRRFPKGDLVAAEGDAAEAIAVVVDGAASVYHVGADGRRIAFESAGPGDPVLAVAALAGGRLPASVEAASDLVLAWLSRDALFQLMTDEPKVSRDLVTDLARRVVRLTGTVQTLSLDVPSRLAGWLFQRTLSGAMQTPEGLEIHLGITKGELAETLGTVPETLSRSLGKLQSEGLIENRGSTIVVRDVGGLAKKGAGYSEG